MDDLFDILIESGGNGRLMVLTETLIVWFWF